MEKPFGTAVRDFIFPLALVRSAGGALHIEQVLGTAFLVGERGYAVTASHVLSGQDAMGLVGMFALHGMWVVANVVGGEQHPSQDIALLRLDGGDALPRRWSTPFRLRTTWEGPSFDYMLWGYPEDLFFEATEHRDHLGRVPVRPDLVCCKGYIRRRLSMPVPNLRGSYFYELSDLAGAGCSGSPVFTHRTPEKAWDVVGVYVGERRREDGVSVGYATRIDALADWAPSILGKTVVEESLAFTP